jgi:hypothetical protein
MHINPAIESESIQPLHAYPSYIRWIAIALMFLILMIAVVWRTQSKNSDTTGLPPVQSNDILDQGHPPPYLPDSCSISGKVELSDGVIVQCPTTSVK